LAAPVQRVGAYHSPVPFAKKLETEFVPTLARIETAIRATLD
jgi:pyruvate/2-oxoglutarate/acetoin dehydrogenase E1 component